MTASAAQIHARTHKHPDGIVCLYLVGPHLYGVHGDAHALRQAVNARVELYDDGTPLASIEAVFAEPAVDALLAHGAAKVMVIETRLKPDGGFSVHTSRHWSSTCAIPA